MDAIWKEKIPASAKRYVRRRGLKSIKPGKAVKDFNKVMNDLVNKGHSPKGFAVRNVADADYKKLSEAVVRRLTE